MKKKMVLSFMLVLALLIMPMSFAEGSSNFSDVSEGDWYYDAVKRLTDYGVIGGYGDGTFRPFGNVKRSEYSKLMVAGLSLDLNKTIPSIFIDVDNSYWAKPYIMTAKNYLTAYNTAAGVEFRPETYAEREDITVALVKALGYGNESYSESTLDRFEDEDQISANLRKYVAIAVEKELIGGSETDGKLYFKPRSQITRAETAQLLVNIIDAEKIVFDDEDKVVMGDSGSAPVVTGYTKDDGTVQLNWTKTDSAEFEFYKVVYSKTNPNPAYPNDSYLFYIDNVDKLSATVNKLPTGTYYFSVTSKIGGEYYAGNAVKLSVNTYDDVDYVTPKVYADEIDNGIVVEWDKIEHPKLKGYKVVVAKHGAPVYPDDGYIYWITDLSKTRAVIEANQKYNNGNIGGKVSPGDYYVSVTAVYSDKKVAGNAVKVEMEGEVIPDEPYVTPYLEAYADYNKWKLYLEWDKIDHAKFQGYKIVVSESNPNPVYPTDGYLKWITDENTTSYYVTEEMGYNGFEGLKKIEGGKSYYFSITAVYSDKKVPGNVIYIEVP